MPTTAAERAAKDLEKANATVESLGAKLGKQIEKLTAAEEAVETLQAQHDEALAIRDHLATHPALQTTVTTQSGEAEVPPTPEPVPTAAGLPVADEPFDPFS
jgi:hypothetical protein